MTTLKRKLLEDTYQKFFEVATSEIIPLKTLDAILLDDISGFGTAVDERVFSKSAFYTIIERQREQCKDLDMKWNIVPMVHRVSKNGNSAVFSDDIIVKMDIDGESIKMELRFTVVLEFQDDTWFIVHWHGSKPEQVESETDTFGVDQWKQKTTELEKIVTERTSDLVEKNKELETVILQLKATQSQLIQSEKMASLGELTAGIAHEIQNPLNFVNNFSEVNVELIDEMQDELKTGNYDEVIAISNDIKENQKKINHHGKRADSIVKGMLKHSRNTSGEKEPTNINAIADEYLRLAYHGLRAKDKTFNATLNTNFDESLGKINVVAQDIGRVILNLITNALHAISPKVNTPNKEPDKTPTIWLSTKQLDDHVFITVKDNGSGIPKDILDKIFQPFFTTKVSGEGTGLGLSMSYDIIKSHGGELKVESKEGEGTTFTINIPK